MNDMNDGECRAFEQSASSLMYVHTMTCGLVVVVGTIGRRFGGVPYGTPPTCLVSILVVIFSSILLLHREAIRSLDMLRGSPLNV